MDVVAHGLWAAVMCRWCGRNQPIARSTTTWTIGLAVAPDLVQLTPIVTAALITPQGWTAMKAYFSALPGYQPVLPPMVELIAHHLHCTMHSALVAAVVTLLSWILLRRFWLPLLGLWMHIVIDVFTHSADFYPSPVLYPITQRGFDGWAWNDPWQLALNYGLIAIFWFIIRSQEKLFRDGTTDGHHK